jgi:Kef-type K+ transport system membrane component KefB
MGLPWEEAIATGCSFGPTSAGIAMNVPQQCGILQAPIGQLVVAIAIADDMLALVVLSQLGALVGEGDLDVTALVIPIISALLWLILGGFIAVYFLPSLLERICDASQNLKVQYDERRSTKRHNKNDEGSFSIDTVTTEEKHDADDSSPLADLCYYNHMWHILPLLVISLPATFYSQASYLIGAFLTGLATRHEKAADHYNNQLGQVIPWLMRILFATSIAFQIPVTLFNDPKVIGNGFLLSLALLGKIAVGPLLTPILLSSGKKWDRHHIRDCCIVGFSMAGQAEFAFLVARFGFESGLIQNETYASINFAILLSTIVSPVLLRVTLAVFVVDVDPDLATTEKKTQNRQYT